MGVPSYYGDDVVVEDSVTPPQQQPTTQQHDSKGWRYYRRDRQSSGDQTGVFVFPPDSVIGASVFSPSLIYHDCQCIGRAIWSTPEMRYKEPLTYEQACEIVGPNRVKWLTDPNIINIP